MTKYLSVSSGLPGPINFSHQPGCGFAGVLWAWLDADKPVCSRMALVLSALSAPHVSYATLNSGRMPPQSSRMGCCEWNCSVWPDVYDGSGPDSERRESDAERDSWASRHGNDRAGLVDSSVRAAPAC